MLDLFTVGLIVVVLGLWLRWRASKFTVFDELGIPGPKPNILFGNVMEMVRNGFWETQDDWIKRYGDVFGYYYGTYPTVVVSDPELMKQILIKDFSAFADRPNNFLGFDGDDPKQPANAHMINMTGKRWKTVRSMLTPTFTSGKLKQMIPMLDDCCLLMMKKLKEASGKGSKDVEMSQIFEGVTMDAIGRAAFGVEAPVQDDPNHPLLRFGKLLFGVDFCSVMNVIYVSFREFQFILTPLRTVLFTIIGGGKHPLNELFNMSTEVVQLRKKDPSRRRNDFLQTIIDARETEEEISEQSLTAEFSEETKTDELPNVEKKVPVSTDKNLRRLSDLEVSANAFLFLLAGYETTTSALSYLTHNLVNDPDAQEKVREEIFDVIGREGSINFDDLSKLHYLERCLMETLRLHPPIYSFSNRVSSREVQLGKWKIPAGTTVQIPVYNVHYNPEHFEDPHTFNPDRFLPENRGKNHSVTWQPFGSGPRNCIGMRFAVFEIKLIFIKILRKYRLEPSDKTELGKLKVDQKIGVIHPSNGIHLRAVPL